MTERGEVKPAFKQTTTQKALSLYSGSKLEGYLNSLKEHHGYETKVDPLLSDEGLTVFSKAPIGKSCIIHLFENDRGIKVIFATSATIVVKDFLSEIETRGWGNLDHIFDDQLKIPFKGFSNVEECNAKKYADCIKSTCLGLRGK